MKVSEIINEEAQKDQRPALLIPQGGEHPKAVRKAGKKLLRKYKKKGELPMFLKKQAESVEI